MYMSTHSGIETHERQKWHVYLLTSNPSKSLERTSSSWVKSPCLPVISSQPPSKPQDDFLSGCFVQSALWFSDTLETTFNLKSTYYGE